ncbi:unnamed protein product [Camellia sinensis]
MASSLIVLYTALVWWWCYLLCNILAASCIMANEIDRLALVAFKAAIVQDPFGVFTSWNHSLHHCHWNDILCSHRHPDRVIGLTLDSQGLVGSLSPYIGNLSFLKVIDLQSNSFHGPIPQEMGRLFRLQTIEFNNNSFGGGIPNNLSRCSKLEWLNLLDNNLTGNIPAELGSLSRLGILALSKNKLSRTIPPSIGNLSSLSKHSLAECNLQGEIPGEITKLRGLTFVQLSQNKLSGKVPSGLYNISIIILLSLAENQLEGNIPDDIGSTLPDHKFLYFVNNLFTGTLPTTLSNASKLEWIVFSANDFSGTMPRDLGKLTCLQTIAVHQNRLQDDLTFISSLTNCTSIGNLLSLTVLSTAVNNLAGPIPSFIGRLQKLHALYLDQNKFTELPSSLGNLTLLITLNLEENNIHGSMPPSLGNCHSLLELDLYKNNLNGSIPPKIMNLSSISIFLLLYHNALTGSLPLEVGSLKNLAVMDLSYNRLSGSIPNTLSSCLSLEWLLLEANSFEGEIPQSLSTLRGLIGSFAQQFVKADPKLSRSIAKLDLPPCSSSNSSKNKLSHKLLLKATNGFSEANLIGVGSYASVYKGILDQCYGQWNLDKWLHQVGVGDHGHQEEPRYLQLIQRLDISADVASALEYLHCGRELTIIHGDLKPSNVLLDDEMMSHIGDFGLTKIISTTSSVVAQGQSNSFVIRGTIGYVALEYGMGDMASTIGDVYSFGILLLEIFIGKRPTDNMFKDLLNLHNFIKNALPDRVMEIVDPCILLEHNTRRRIKTAWFPFYKLGLHVQWNRQEIEWKWRVTSMVLQ